MIRDINYKMIERFSIFILVWWSTRNLEHDGEEMVNSIRRWFQDYRSVAIDGWQSITQDRKKNSPRHVYVCSEARTDDCENFSRVIKLSVLPATTDCGCKPLFYSTCRVNKNYTTLTGNWEIPQKAVNSTTFSHKIKLSLNWFMNFLYS